MLELAEPAQINDLLDRLEIYRADHAALTRGVPGQPVTPVDQELLTLSPLRHYQPGETVAYKDKQNIARYAVVVKYEQNTVNGGSGVLGHVTIKTSETAAPVVLLSSEVHNFRTGTELKSNRPVPPAIVEAPSSSPPSASSIPSASSEKKTDAQQVSIHVGGLLILQK